MQLHLGRPVHCSDAELGSLADVVVDPNTRRITHLVVHTDNSARLIPIELARDADQRIELTCTVAEAGQLPRADNVEFLSLGEVPANDVRGDVGIMEMVAMPNYEGADILGTQISMTQSATVSYDRVPQGEVEIRRQSAVISSDDHVLGHVEGFLVADDGQVGHIVLEHGHLWGRREVTIPIDAVSKVENDRVYLSIPKDAVPRS
jgi:sporulation protein YlmC with PRC-barrel domain